MESIDCW